MSDNYVSRLETDVAALDHARSDSMRVLLTRSTGGNGFSPRKTDRRGAHIARCYRVGHTFVPYVEWNMVRTGPWKGWTIELIKGGE